MKDIFGQAWEAMVYNRRRTAITVIGVVCKTILSRLATVRKPSSRSTTANTARISKKPR